MTTLTPTQLDKARAEEALRRAAHRTPVDVQPADAIACYQELLREGWMPSEPVDPVVLAVREIVTTVAEEDGLTTFATGVRAGQSDKKTTMVSALAAYHAGQSSRDAVYREVVEAAKALRFRISGGVKLTAPFTPVRELLATFDAALAKLEASK